MIANIEHSGGPANGGGLNVKLLGEIITPYQAERVLEIIEHAQKHHASSQQLVQAMTDYFRTIEKQLLKNGVIPDYLAWFIFANLTGAI